MNTDEVEKLVAKFPVPAAKDGKLAEVDKAATDEAVAGLLKGGRDSVRGLVAMIVPEETGGDSQARHALHALVTHVCGPKQDDGRRMVAEVLAATLAEDRPPAVHLFVLRQLQLVG